MEKTWTYEQKSGSLVDPDGKTVGRGYSGHGPGLNNPLAEAEEGVGPIPRGNWAIAQWFDRYQDKGPQVARLLPQGFDAHGRAGFLIHGDNALQNFSASHGCIILPRPIRNLIRESGVTMLTVTA